MQIDTIIPSIPPQVKFRPISGYSSHSSQFQSISAEIQISAGTRFWLKKKIIPPSSSSSSSSSWLQTLLLLIYFLFFSFFFWVSNPSSSFSSSSGGFRSLLLLFFSFLFFLLVCFSFATSCQSAFPFLFMCCTCNVCYYLSTFPLNAMSFVLNFLFV